jgi:putative aldouronate transport system permease protein
LSIVFLLYSLACALPVILIFMVSITDEGAVVRNGYSLFPEAFSSLAYQYLFDDWRALLQAYGVTVFVAIAGTAFNIIVTALLAYPLSRSQFAYGKAIGVAVLIPMLFNGGMVPFYMTYVSVLNLKNSIMALILPGVLSGFNVFVMRTYFKANIPPPVLESAFIDGASELRIFFRIVLPLSMPVMATVAFFSFLNYWNDWFNCLLFITDEKLWNVQYIMMRAMRQLQYFRSHLHLAGGYAIMEMSKLPDEGVRMALAVVGMAPILCVYPFFQKYFVKGLTIGAVKG